MPQLQENFLKPTEHLRNLKLLEEISQDSAVSQRKLSNRLDIALGVTNACLRRMVRRGYIRAKGINHKRIAYYLTPKGIQEKTRLTYHFLSFNIRYYVELKKSIVSKLQSIAASGARRIIFYGAGEVMEIAYITLQGTNLKLAGIVDDSLDKQGKKVFGFIIQGPGAINKFKPDVVMVTSIKYKDEILRNLDDNNELKEINFYSL